MSVPGWADELAGDGPADLVAEVVALAVAGATVHVQQQVLQPDAGRAAAVVPRLWQLVGRPGAAAVERAARTLLGCGARVVVAGEKGYPPTLARAWPDLGAPLWLFVRGSQLPDGPAAAIVGTRAPTLDGLATAGALARRVARAGGVVVSGMARGIDQAAHSGAIEGGGPTVAVLGAGFGVDYPAGNRPLREAIALSGALVTELLPHSPPYPHHFLARNRIVSGLADVTVVVEGRARSGAIHTARLAAAQGRDVLAVPGPVTAATSRAPLDLIRDGATPLTHLDDVVVALGLRSRPDSGAEGAQVRGPTLSATARALLPLLGAVPASPGALAAAARRPVPAVLAAITELVTCGLAQRSPRGVVRG